MIALISPTLVFLHCRSLICLCFTIARLFWVPFLLCLVPIDGAFPFFHCFLRMVGPRLPLEYLLLVTTTTYIFSFLITVQLPVIHKHSAVSVLHLLFTCWEALTPLLTTYACSFSRKPLLPLSSPGLTARSSNPWSMGLCLLPAWHLPSKLPCFPTSSWFSRQPSQCN